MSIDGESPDDGAAGEPFYDPERDARLWVRALSEFIVNHQPIDAETESVVPYGVQSARNQAVMAAYERIERLCRVDEPSPARAASLGSVSGVAATPSEN